MHVVYSCEDHNVRHPRLNSGIANELACILNLNNCINLVVLLAQSVRPNIIYFGHYPPDLTVTSIRVIVLVRICSRID